MLLSSFYYSFDHIILYLFILGSYSLAIEYNTFYYVLVLIINVIILSPSTIFTIVPFIIYVSIINNEHEIYYKDSTSKTMKIFLIFIPLIIISINNYQLNYDIFLVEHISNNKNYDLIKIFYNNSWKLIYDNNLMSYNNGIIDWIYITVNNYLINISKQFISNNITYYVPAIGIRWYLDAQIIPQYKFYFEILFNIQPIICAICIAHRLLKKNPKLSVSLIILV